MARRKKSTKKAAPRKRKRMGGINGKMNPLMSMLIGGGGLIGATVLAKTLGPNLDDKIKAGIMVAAGYVIPTYLIKSPTGLALGVGVGIAGVGKAASSFGIISGINSMVNGAPMIAGARAARRINGVRTPGIISDNAPMVSGMNTGTSAARRFSGLGAR